MKIKKAELQTVCGITSTLPDTGQPEAAFAGRSNVGKSSLINCLLNRKNLARTSSQPGKTQTINFYHINDIFYLVDLPGYGYAKVSEAVKAKWGKMIERYLRSSKNLKKVFLLVDIRHEPSKNDIQMMEWMRGAGFSPVIVATKLDKIKRSQQAKQLKLIRQTLKMKPEETLIAFSSETRDGRDALLAELENILPVQEGEETENVDGTDRRPES